MKNIAVEAATRARRRRRHVDQSHLKQWAVQRRNPSLYRAPLPDYKNHHLNKSLFEPASRRNQVHRSLYAPLHHAAPCALRARTLANARATRWRNGSRIGGEGVASPLSVLKLALRPVTNHHEWHVVNLNSLYARILVPMADRPNETR